MSHSPPISANKGANMYNKGQIPPKGKGGNPKGPKKDGTKKGSTKKGCK